MRKLYFIILSMFAFGLAQEAMAQDIPSAATLEAAPNVCIKNVRSGKNVYASAEGSVFLQKAGMPNLDNVFRFVKTGNNMYKIFSVSRGLWVNNPTNGTYTNSLSSAQVWYTGNFTASNQFSIRNQSGTEGNIAWNDLASNAVTYYNATDAGSSWTVEQVDLNAEINAYKPVARLASLQAGTEVMVFNTTRDGENKLRTGFLQAGASSFLRYDNITAPLRFEGEESHVFILQQSTTLGKWWLKSKANNKYVAVDGSINSEVGVDLNIEDYAVADPAKKGGASSLSDDGQWIPGGSIASENHVWLIGDGGTTLWNGNPNQFAIWSSGHPFAFYTVRKESTLYDQMAQRLTDTWNRLQPLRNKVGGPQESTIDVLKAACDVSDKTTPAFFAQGVQALKTVQEAEGNMPEDGKVYAVVSVTNPSRADAETYMVVGSDGRITLSTGNGYSTDNAAKFVARKQADGKFVLSNGRYNHTLQFTGNTERKLSDGYDASYSPIRIVSVDPSKAEVKLLVYRNTSTPSCAIIVNKQTNVLDKIRDEDWTGGQQFSIRFRLEEVNDYPATVNLRASADVQGAAAMSTWSAPYASVCPEGVKAYYASENGTVARMTAVEGAIPANQGVVLVGAEAGVKTPLPVAGEAVGAITGNLLGNTAGRAAEIPEGSFVLSQKNNVTAFYKLSDYTKQLPANRAYLRASTAEGGSRQLVFGFDDATGIPTLQDAAQQNQPTYDLSGRAVSAKRQGLYIRGGKKFIVK